LNSGSREFDVTLRSWTSIESEGHFQCRPKFQVLLDPSLCGIIGEQTQRDIGRDNGGAECSGASTKGKAAYREIHLDVVQHTTATLRLLVDVDVFHQTDDAPFGVHGTADAALHGCVSDVGPALHPLRRGNGRVSAHVCARVCPEG